MLTELDKEWLSFTTNKAIRKKDERKKLSKKEIEENITDIYISTKTKIAYLNTSVPLHDIFWKLPVLDYSIPKNGILKKSIKINCMNETETKELNNLIDNEKNINISIISDLKTDKHYKDVRKIDIGICKKDLLSYRMKKKGAFYNCFAIIMRVLFEDKYKEVVRQRAKHILSVTNVYMMSPAPGCEVTKEKYDMWFTFYEWIREKVKDIGDNKDTEQSLRTCCLEIEDMLKQLN